eukprot:189484-Pleurochrysis_carterae.AAC.1
MPATLCQVCVWSEVYKNECIPQMQGIGHYWTEDACGEGSYATWRAARTRALKTLANETYGSDYPKPFRLISRADHSAFKECPECKRLRLQLAELLKNGEDITVVRAAKAEQKQHCDWFLKQRRELDTMRHSG